MAGARNLHFQKRFQEGAVAWYFAVSSRGPRLGRRGLSDFHGRFMDDPWVPTQILRRRKLIRVHLVSLSGTRAIAEQTTSSV